MMAWVSRFRFKLKLFDSIAGEMKKMDTKLETAGGHGI